MKAFAAALAVFIILAAAAAYADRYVAKAADEMLGMAEELPADRIPQAETIARIEERWEAGKDVIAVFVNRNVTDKAEGCLYSLSAAAKAGDGGEYAVRLSQLKDALASLRRIASPFG